MSAMNQRFTKSTTVLGVLSATALSVSMFGFGNTQTQINTDSAATAKVGQAAPNFTLTDADGVEHTLKEYTAKGQTVVLEWFSPMCPFVKKHYTEDTQTMLNIQAEHKDEPVVWLRVNSAKASHPSTGAKANKAAAENWGITTPILLDPTGEVGMSYGAKRTPEMYIIDSSGTLVYHGAIDNRPDAQAPGDVNYVNDALTQTLAGESVSKSTTTAYGCSIKY